MGTYLVTGGCGFIGSHLVESLANDGHKVRVLDDLSSGSVDNVPKNVEVRVGSVTDIATVESAIFGVDGCFHLAAIVDLEQYRTDRKHAHETNLQGTVNVFQCARETASADVPVVYASSAAVYGDTGVIPLHERLAPAPITDYARDKLACEQHARSAGTQSRVSPIGLRLFNVYGPRQDVLSPYSGVVAHFVKAFTRRFPLTIFGDGQQTRDFIYVDDAVRFLRRAMDRLPSQEPVVNVCTGTSASINDLVKILETKISSSVKVRYEPRRKNDIEVSVGDPSRAETVLEMKAEVGLADGLSNVVDWFRST